MKIIRVNKNTQNSVIAYVVRIIKNGGVVVYPTETAYGLGADFLNPKAVRKVYQIKGRNYKKPLSVLVSSLKIARQYVRFNQLSLKLAKKYWPGPLTLVLELGIRNKELGIRNNKLQALGLRISSSNLAMAIVRKFGRPITATSANLAGQKECYSINEVIKQFANKKYQPDLVIDVGKLPKKQMSTIVRVDDNQLTVLRDGVIKLE